ncbi:hypothetical protein B0J11DRAFT_502339 [Dendryphion nanum]|uniref:Adenylate kinase n=1 Tax=Dendryphion nanum TaxID=256645 RepID=A0A9P9EE76_9PLEO|nr:hypothetical protein B0J11DRAFT_502339 [Dendryphion nanum]
MAIADAIEQGKKGILVDGYPRCEEQVRGYEECFKVGKLVIGSSGKPHLVLSFSVTKEYAKQRYVDRSRDVNDDEHKFEKRFVKHERENPAVEKVYRDLGTLIECDANGSKEQNVNAMMENLSRDETWRFVERL